MIRLEVSQGPGRREIREFDQEIVNLGRAASNHLVIDNPYVSSEHGQVYLSGERLYYCDLNSTNGSALVRQGEEKFFKNEKLEVGPGDVLVLGGKESPIILRIVALEVEEESDTSRTIVASRSVTQARELGERLGKDSAALAALFRLVRDLASTRTRTDMNAQIAEALLGAYDQARLVCIYERRGEKLAPVVVKSVTDKPRTPDEIPATLRDKLEREKETILIELPGTKSARGTGTGLLAPLLSQDRLLGALRIEVSPGAGTFDDRDLDLLTVFAAHAAKSLENIELLEALRASQARLADENKFLRSQAQPHSEIVGNAPAMRALMAQVEKVIPTDTTVLILGETGTGKELVARAIHTGGPRKDRLFVARNCGAIPENLIESELFGHMKGSFTGATENKRGVFDVADGGTVFLDEIGELPLSMQVKLLRVLQEGEVLSVGATQPHKVNVRVVSATNKNLEQEVKAGRFREDLYYRLNVFPVKVPPLRERREDIGALAHHFLRKVSGKFGRTNLEIDEDAVEALSAYNWPGNVRELENEMERAAISAEREEPVGVAHLSDRVLESAGSITGSAVPDTGSLKGRLLEKEKEIIRETLSQTGGNRTKAAEILGISRQAFMKKISKYGIR